MLDSILISHAMVHYVLGKVDTYILLDNNAHFGAHIVSISQILEMESKEMDGRK